MNSSIRLRRCTRDDCVEILQLWKNADATPSVTDTLEEVQRVVEEGHAIFLVATDEAGHVVGSVIGGWDGWRGNIYRLAVAPAARRRKVAAALVNEVSVRLGREKGARRITALVEKAHPDAMGFWDSMASDGYIFEPRLVRYVRPSDVVAGLRDAYFTLRDGSVTVLG
jgi:ribosomal protein S18 acetylase RimI-like enzyme